MVWAPLAAHSSFVSAQRPAFGNDGSSDEDTLPMVWFSFW